MVQISVKSLSINKMFLAIGIGPSHIFIYFFIHPLSTKFNVPFLSNLNVKNTQSTGTADLPFL